LPTEAKLQERLSNVLFYAIVILLAYLVYLVFAPFLVALAWAAVLVVVSYPAYEWLARRWGATGAAAACTVGVTLILIVPAVLVMTAFVRQAVGAIESLELQATGGHLAWLSDLWTHLQQRFPEARSEDLAATLHRYGEQVAEFVASRLGAILRHTALFFFHLGVTILAMFYLFRDGPSIIARLREMLPFERARGERMLGDARDLVFASVTSSLVSAMAHGTLGGTAFAITGLSAPIFWGVMMGFCSLIPAVGSALIWVPAAISLVVGGHTNRGILLVVFCLAIAGFVDYLVRPWLISGRAEMSGLVIFISVLGGIGVFGMLGVVLGPIIVAAAASLLDVHGTDVRAGNAGA
jgi:predicted PurR-regulated permease PerM